jgi:hypothetical protein
MSTTSHVKDRELKVSKLAEKIIGSEIIKLAAEVNEKIKNGDISMIRQITLRQMVCLSCAMQFLIY